MVYCFLRENRTRSKATILQNTKKTTTQKEDQEWTEVKLQIASLFFLAFGSLFTRNFISTERCFSRLFSLVFALNLDFLAICVVTGDTVTEVINTNKNAKVIRM